MKILLVYPATPETFWSFKHVLRFVSKRASFPPLGLLTIAAFLPADWKVKLVDENVTRLTDDDLDWADYVMLSAMIVHKTAVPEIVSRCRRLGTQIIAGGPLFTTGHGAFPEIDHFVLGEAEKLMPQVIEDMRRGAVRPTYTASSRPDITRVPSPRWDLIDLRSYFAMSVQFSRGCPFDCEFWRQFEFIQRSGVVTAMVGLLTALPETRLYRRLTDEGRIETESTGNNTQAALNFRPRLDREFLVNGYRRLMKELYQPRNYYRRIRTFLEIHKPQGPRLRPSWTDFQAFLKSLWLLGFWHRGRLAYWRFCVSTLLRRPRLFPVAIELAIIGHHFRRVAKLL